MKRTAWHLFGLVSGIVFAAGAGSLTVISNDPLSRPQHGFWLYLIVAVIGFAGCLIYAKWYITPK